MIPVAVSAGASRPIVPVTVRPGMPSSTAVGSSGAHGKNARLAGAMEFEQRPGHAYDAHRNLTTDQVRDRRPSAAIGHLDDVWGSSDLSNSPVRCWIEPTRACP
jgi:hypothetical protein